VEGEGVARWFGEGSQEIALSLFPDCCRGSDLESRRERRGYKAHDSARQMTVSSESSQATWRGVEGTMLG
jgi:hypothetical protein